MKTDTCFASLLQAFFTERLIRQRQASSDTIASYRDAFCLLFKYIEKRLARLPSELEMEDLNADIIVDFLCWLEEERGNSARTRNARLAAIHSFFKYAALHDPCHSLLIQRILAIPGKKYKRTIVEYLTYPETEALLAAPDQNCWKGRRDGTLLQLMVQTGMRVSEIVGLNSQNVVLDTGAYVWCNGKGRKERCTPLDKQTAKSLRDWLSEKNGLPMDPLFPNARGMRMSRDGIEYILRKHVRRAAQKCPSLKKKKISPHVLRHTTAMSMLQSGIDRSVIALWLGHENLETVNIYVRANLKMKQQALDKMAPLEIKPNRFTPDDKILEFLKNL